MPLDQSNLEKKETYPQMPDVSGNVETPKRTLEIVPPPAREGEMGREEELGNKIEAVERHATVAESKLKTAEKPKTIEQHGQELLDLVDKIPEGGNVDLKQVENKCAEIVNFIIGNDFKKPETVKEELIAFAKNYFKNNSSHGFILTELFKVADPIISKEGY